MEPASRRAAVFDQLARISKALSSPRRLELVDLLCQGPRTVESLAEAAGMSVANASQHLKVLRQAQLVVADKQGLYVTCALADASVSGLYVQLRDLATRRLAELEAIGRSLHPDPDPDAPSDDALLELALSGDAVVLDVRPRDEFAAGHLPGARSVPLPELPQLLGELPRDRPIVAYCRGPYCGEAASAVEALRGKGYSAWCLKQGPPDWLAQGRQLER